jgi:hypothetical protein
LKSYFSLGYYILVNSLAKKDLSTLELRPEENINPSSTIKSYIQNIKFKFKQEFIFPIFYGNDFSFILNEFEKFEKIKKERDENEKKEQESLVKPSWKVLYFYDEIDAKSFDENIKNLELEVIKSSSCHPSIFLHKISILLFFKKQNCFDFNFDIKECVKNYFMENDLSDFFSASSVNMIIDGGTGYEYLMNDDDFFEEIKGNFIDNFNSQKKSHEKSKKEKEKEKETYISELIDIKNFEEEKSLNFISNFLCNGNYDFFENYIKEFSNNIFNFSNKDLNKLSKVVEEKHSLIFRNIENKIFLKLNVKYHEQELYFWKSLHGYLNENKKENLFDRFLLTRFVTQLEKEIISILEQAINNGRGPTP